MNSYGSSDIPLQRPEDAEEWKGTPFHGDFYREVDNVTRGVTLPPADPLVGGGHSYKDFDPLNGDFYREPDELCKGLSLGGGSYLDQQSLFGASGIDYARTLQDDSRSERFEEADIPLPVPADSFFKLEATTLYGATCMPFQIGNDLLDFLEEQVSTLTKVRRLKFSIKADVFVDGMMCTLKIRVYSQAAQQFAIEFQRRSGDGITFNNTFQKAYQFLGSRPHLNLLPLEAPLLLNSQPLQLPLGFEEPTNGEEHIQPLLDLMGKVDAPWLQAEAALSLSKFAAEGKPALRTDHVFQGISQLLQSSSADVDHPTACLLLHLAQQSEAAPLFGSSGLLMSILGKVRSPQTNAQIRRQFAQAFYCAVQLQSVMTLTQNDAAMLMRDVSDTLAMKDVDCNLWGKEVFQNLEMAQLHLSRQFQATHWA